MAPFVVAIAPLALCGVLIVQNWSENYGNRQSKLVQSCMDGLRVIIQVSKDQAFVSQDTLTTLKCILL